MCIAIARHNLAQTRSEKSTTQHIKHLKPWQPAHRLQALKAHSTGNNSVAVLGPHWAPSNMMDKPGTAVPIWERCISIRIQPSRIIQGDIIQEQQHDLCMPWLGMGRQRKNASLQGCQPGHPFEDARRDNIHPQQARTKLYRLGSMYTQPQSTGRDAGLP